MKTHLGASVKCLHHTRRSTATDDTGKRRGSPWPLLPTERCQTCLMVSVSDQASPEDSGQEGSRLRIGRQLRGRGTPSNWMLSRQSRPLGAGAVALALRHTHPKKRQETTDRQLSSARPIAHSAPASLPSTHKQGRLYSGLRTSPSHLLSRLRPDARHRMSSPPRPGADISPSSGRDAARGWATLRCRR